MFRGMILAVAAAACMGLLAVFAKLGYQAGLSDVALLHYRFIFAALILGVAILVKDPRQLKARPATLLKAAVLGGGVYFVMSRCFFRALMTIPAATAALLLYIYPLVVTLAAAVIFRQPITRRTMASLAAVLAGCCLIFIDAFRSEADATGVLFGLAAMLSYSVYLLATQLFIKNEDPLAVSFWIFVFAALSFTCLNNPMGLFGLDGRQLMICFAIGLVPCALAIVMLNVAVRLVGSAHVSIFSSVEPAVTALAAAFWLGESVAGAQLAGMACIMLGVTLPGLVPARAGGDRSPAP